MNKRYIIICLNIYLLGTVYGGRKREEEGEQKKEGKREEYIFLTSTQKPERKQTVGHNFFFF